MVVRVKRHWFAGGRVRSAEEQASVVAVTVWKSATNGLNGLRKAGFGVEVGAPYLRVLTEFVAFMVTVADRVAYLHGAAERADGWREAFLGALGRRLAEIYQENLDALATEGVGSAASPGRHGATLIALINQRMAEYAEFDYDQRGPEFAFLRYFGSCIEALIDDPRERRWVLDQVMASQGPEAIEYVDKAMRGVLGLDPKPRRRAA